MNSKERILTILNHEKSDMVPVTNRFTIEVSKELARILNLDYSDSFDLEVELGHDLLCTKEIGIVNAYSIEGNKKIGNNLFVDDFGILKKKVDYGMGFYIEIIKNPLDDLDNFTSYKLPDPNNQEIIKEQYENFEKNIKKYGKSHAIVGGVTCTIFEAAEMLRGMERIMVDMVENEDFINELMDKLVDYHFKIGKKLIELGVDIIYIGDDVGMQTGMMISPDLWRKFLKPRYDYLFRRWKNINKNIIFALHSDGYIEPIIGDLVEIGLDILNPVQPGTMDDCRLKRKFGDKLSFWGGMDVQKTIPFGTPENVISEVKNRIEIFGNNGGFIISSSHNVQPNIRSIDNTFIYYWACMKYGKYNL